MKARTRRGLAATGALALLVAGGSAVVAAPSLPERIGGSVAVEPITGLAPTPVSPLEAVAITELYARQAPPLPDGVAALVQNEAPAAPSPSVRAAAAAAAAAEEGEHPGGTSCDAQMHAHAPDDANANGIVDPWEANPHANETCETEYIWETETGSGVLETRTETVTAELSATYGGLYDREVGRTYTRTAARETHSEAAHHHSGVCSPTQQQWERGLELTIQTRDFLDQYTNNPVLLRQHGYWPYPVPGTKTFHWFNSGLSGNGTNYYEDRDTETDESKWRREGEQRLIDPEAQEMFTMALTDDGYVADNVAYVYVYDGDADPFSIDANAPGQRPGVDGDNEGLGCLLYWHGHTEGAEGAATANTDGRTWMAHLWFYGGLYPFGDADLDGSEPHGWFTPLNRVPAFCNHNGGCI